jgi:hypothetical protein
MKARQDRQGFRQAFQGLRPLPEQQRFFGHAHSDEVLPCAREGCTDQRLGELLLSS